MSRLTAADFQLYKQWADSYRQPAPPPDAGGTPAAAGDVVHTYTRTNKTRGRRGG